MAFLEDMQAAIAGGLDEVRRVDELGRADRRRQRAAAAQGEAGSYHGTVSLDELIERGYHGGAEQDELAERYEAEDLRMRVRSAMTCLPPRQREVLERYYGQSLTLRERLGGNQEARACSCRPGDPEHHGALRRVPIRVTSPNFLADSTQIARQALAVLGEASRGARADHVGSHTASRVDAGAARSLAGQAARKHAGEVVEARMAPVSRPETLGCSSGVGRERTERCIQSTYRGARR